MITLNRVMILSSVIILTACGGGGGGGGGDDTSYTTPANRTPTITNTTLNVSVPENQTSAFTITATDPDNDSLTYSLGGIDGSLFSVSTSGVVTFNTAPDFENPSDSDTNNIYELMARVTDGTLTDSKDFTVTVTNDTSDDVTSSSYDGTLVGFGPIQSASICIESTANTCDGASFTTTSSQDGTFSLTVDSGTTGVIRSEGGFDPVTNLQLSDYSSFALGQPVTNQNFVISPLSTLMSNYDNSTDYDTFKTKLGLDNSFMIRFDNPFNDLSSSSLNRAAVINTQVSILNEVLNGIHTFSGDSSYKKIAGAIYNRSGSETSLGDTTFIKDMLTNLDTDFSPSSSQLEDISSGISAYLQKINANSSNSHSHFAKAGMSELKDLMKSVMDGTSSSDDIDKLVFNTINWINENTSWNGGSISDNEENLSVTTYDLSNNGSSNYIVDNVNARETEFIIYVKEGDVIKFEATSSVIANHPFLMSTESNDMDSSNDVGAMEGWNSGTLTLTVDSDTPDVLYPHCQFHNGMYANSKIVKVSSYDQTKIDIESSSSALQVKGTVATGPYKGASGFTYKVYLNPQGGSEHTHTFHEYPGLTFYMPADQGYHGAESATSDEKFKPKSHFNQNSNSNNNGY